VGAQSHGVQLVLSLVLQPDLQDIAGEHAVLQKELVVLLQGAQGFLQRAGDGGDGLLLRGRQVVGVLVQRRAGVDLVLDTVQASSSAGKAR